MELLTPDSFGNNFLGYYDCRNCATKAQVVVKLANIRSLLSVLLKYQILLNLKHLNYVWIFYFSMKSVKSNSGFESAWGLERVTNAYTERVIG